MRWSELLHSEITVLQCQTVFVTHFCFIGARVLEEIQKETVLLLFEFHVFLPLGIKMQKNLVRPSSEQELVFLTIINTFMNQIYSKFWLKAQHLIVLQPYFFHCLVSQPFVQSFLEDFYFTLISDQRS